MKLAHLLLALGVLFSGAAHAVNPVVEMKTTEGTVMVELLPAQAPNSVRYFLEYVNSGVYKGTLFHRVVKDFIVQGGGFNASLEPIASLPPLPNEAGESGLLNQAGTLALARDSRDPHSARGQFFFNLDDNKILNHYRKDNDYWGYSVFGRIISGLEVAKKIGSIPTAPRDFLKDAPEKTVVLEDVRLLSEPEAVALLGPDKPVKPVKLAKKKSRKKSQTM